MIRWRMKVGCPHCGSSCYVNDDDSMIQCTYCLAPIDVKALRRRLKKLQDEIDAS